MHESSDGVAALALEVPGVPVAAAVQEGAAVVLGGAQQGGAAAAASQPVASMSGARSAKRTRERLTNPKSISQYSSRAIKAFQDDVSSLRQCIAGLSLSPVPSCHPPHLLFARVFIACSATTTTPQLAVTSL